MRLRTKARRGSTMLVLAALVTVTGVLCGIVLESSLQTYRASAMGEQRLQARAAAEGAVVALIADADAAKSPLSIGRCRVQWHDEETTAGLVRVPFDVIVEGRAGNEVWRDSYMAVFAGDDANRRVFEGFEP